MITIVRYGRPPIEMMQAESFSARGLVVAQDREMYDLESLMNAVTIRRTTTTPSIP
jgi:hypothetical protein